MKAETQTDTCKHNVHSIIINNSQNVEPKSSSTVEWINKVFYVCPCTCAYTQNIYVMEYYLAIKGIKSDTQYNMDKP